LGIDLLGDPSTCSFNCIYCQLGDIQNKTAERKVYVPTEKVLADLDQSPWQTADIITISGSGEPTLALNLAEVIAALKAKTQKPVMVLTNATLLWDPEVQDQLMGADQVSVKLDAASDAMLARMNRPVDGVTHDKIMAGILAFKARYTGRLGVQTMFMAANLSEVDALAQCIQQIAPDELQLNTPRRPYPLEWHIDSRGNHSDETPYKARALKTVSREEAQSLEAILAEKTGIPIRSIYRD